MPKINPIPPVITEQDAKRFWNKVQQSSPEACWPYLGEWQKRSPYGTVTLCKRKGVREQRRKVSAHRIAYLLSTGLWPLVDVCHRCDNPPCCNPRHLFQGTRADNMQDAARKGRARAPQGTASPQAKLNDDAVRFIRKAWVAKTHFRRELAELFGVSHGAIQQVTDGRRWKHVK